MWPGRRSPSPLGFGLMFLWSLVLAPGVATAKNILIYGPSMSAAGDGLDNEQTLAEAAGHTVTVVDGETWPGMGTSLASSCTTWRNRPVLGPPLCSWPVECKNRGP